MKKEEYLGILKGQIRCKKARDPVAEEIEGHIEEQMQTFIKSGMSEQEAEEAAVLEMGDPVEAGAELDRIHRPKMAWGMIGLIAVLSVGGLILQALLKESVGYTILVRGLGHNLFYMVIGLGIMMGVCYLDYSRLGRFARELTILLCAGLVLGKGLLGNTMNGEGAWLYILGTGINIRALTILFVPLYAGVIYSFRGQGYKGLAKSVLFMIPGVFTALFCPYVIGAIILLLTFTLTLIIAVWKGWFKVSRKKVLASIAAAAVILPVCGAWSVIHFGASYQSARMEAMLDPSSTEAGYQISAVRELIGTSRLLGSTAGQENMAEVVYDTGDYIFAFTAAYYGILVVAAAVALTGFLFLHFLRLSMRQKNQLGMLMGSACAIVFTVQLVLYVLANMGIIFGGVYCPFFTNGAAGMIVTYVLLGILLSIYRYQNVIPQMKQTSRPPLSFLGGRKIS